VFNQQERMVAKSTLSDLKGIQKKPKTIIFQPFGRGAKLEKEIVMDEESRSLSSKDYLSLGRKLATKYNIVFFGEPQFQLAADNFAGKYTCDLRQWGALIEEADYFVGVDSVGQHMARAVGTPGTVIFGSTFPINTSYPDFFNIFDRSMNKKYAPIRIAGLDVGLANRLNEKTMLFDEKALNDLYTNICNDIEKKVKK
jgi:ADP-heptose:LPS heptosyltransferase